MGVVGGSMKCIKYLLLICNFLVFLTGLGVFIIGILLATKFSAFTTALGATLSVLPWVCIVTGVCLFVIGFLGCCGAWKENTCLLKLYCLLLSILILVELAIAIGAIVLRSQIKAKVDEATSKAVTNYGSNEMLTKFIDTVQENFKCCGASGLQDYSGRIAPNSCENYTEGCAEKLQAFLEKYCMLLLVGAFLFIILQILAVVSGACLAHSVQHFVAV